MGESGIKAVYQREKVDLIKELQTGSSGLSLAQVMTNQTKYGVNELSEGIKKSTFVMFLEQYNDFLVMILLAAALISMFFQDFESSIVIFIVVTINAILGTAQQLKAEQSLNSLKQLSAPASKVLREGTIEVIPSREITIGDIVLLESGDYISADGRILENASLQVNESALTGESVSTCKEDTVFFKEVSLGDQVNMVFSGSFVTYGRGSFLVTGIGMKTEVGKIAELLKEAKEKKTPLQSNLDQFGKKLSIGIVIICAILFVINVMRHEAIGSAFVLAVALAVAAIPEALSSIVTIVLAFGTRKMAKENAIVRKLQAVEGLGSVSIVCCDKTGTLTQNKMTVQSFYVDTVVEHAAGNLPKSEEDLLIASILCNNSTNIEGVEIGDPTEVALINFADKFQLNAVTLRRQYPRLGEIPFDSDRKLMSTVQCLENRDTMLVKGAVDVLLTRMNLSVDKKIEIETVNSEFSEKGLRVLAVAKKQVGKTELTLEDETELEFMGLIAMMDPPREESYEAVRKCTKAGIKTIMITGDHKITATAIARDIGILKNDSESVEGAEMDHLTDEKLKDFIKNKSVYARVSPEHKIRIVRAWQEKGNIVAMTGDGVNDAPALKQADVGIAMGITGTEVAKDSAGVILTDDNFATIVKAIENGRNVYANIKRSIHFLLSGNTAGMITILYTSIMVLPVPFAPIHLLFINLLTDSLPAIALGLESHSKHVMDEKPRPKNEAILTKRFIYDIVIDGCVIAILTLAAFYIGLRNNNQVASTMAFATLCLGRLVHSFNCKSDKQVLFSKRFYSNSYLAGAFMIGFILLNMVLLIPTLGQVFHVASLSISLLLVIYGLSLLNLVIIQTLKLLTLY